MAQQTTWRDRRIRFMHRVHARRVARLSVDTVFIAEPEPRSIGVFSRGQQLVAGKFLFSGLLVEDPRLSVWQIAGENEDVADEVQGCAWLDDLAAVGDDRARMRAQKWVYEWIDLYGHGNGPGWTPDIVGCRLIRWINHGAFLLRGRDARSAAILFESLARQTLFLARRWKVMPLGLPRFEALAGTIYAGLMLEGMERHVDPAVAALTADCTEQIDTGGGVATRNPEDLLELLTLLNWTVEALAAINRRIPPEIMQAVGRIAPTLRALRHTDGGLARFHGGGRGVDGRLDQALAASGVKDLPAAGIHMGFTRLSGGRTSLIVDGAPPPTGADSVRAHASTLAFELTSGRRPLIVNCGSGARFGHEWRRASRATPSHSTLGIDGVSSSHLAPPGRLITHQEVLTDVPGQVLCNVTDGDRGRRLEMSHDGYRPSHGLTHARILEMSVDGRGLWGEDLLATLNADDESVFDGVKGDGIPFALRFHLHPEVAAVQDGAAVRMTLKSGEIWVFTHDGAAEMELSPSVYLQNGRLRPLATQQVVLSGRAMAYATRVRWSLAKADDTPDAVRDLVQADPLDPVD